MWERKDPPPRPFGFWPTVRALAGFVAGCAFLTWLAWSVAGGLIFLIPLMMLPVGLGVWVARAIMRSSGALDDDNEETKPPPPPIPTGRGE
jgi:hypothetical protein